VDTSDERLEIASTLGARAIKLDTRHHKLVGSSLLRKNGYPITVDGSGAVAGLDFAIRSLASGGICTTVAFYLRSGTPVPLWRMYVHGGTLKTGLANVRADLPDILAAVQSGKMRPELVTTLTVNWHEAPGALLIPTTKVVLVRPPVSKPLGMASRTSN
jgi:threonine dehydrogenase-like Zn-dependent dehydrogenase